MNEYFKRGRFVGISKIFKSLQGEVGYRRAYGQIKEGIKSGLLRPLQKYQSAT